MTVEIKVAQALLAIGAVGFTPENPITFKSGLLSPVYIDNRKLIFWPEQWHTIIEGFRQMIDEQQILYEVIAGIETAGVPHSSALAYILQKPSVFVRKQPKEHGTKSRVEGGDVSNRRVLLIEDLVTTGGSSLAGAEALRETGAVVQDCLAITSYGFTMSEHAFKIMEIRLHTLTSFHIIVQEAVKMDLFNATQLALIEDWLKDPHRWAESQGLQA
jgi:orotate phosphoribosyltransferase